MKNIIFVDDKISAERDASLHISTLAKNKMGMAVNTADLKNLPTDAISSSVFVLGQVRNFDDASLGVLMKILLFGTFMKVEYDYAFCLYNGQQMKKFHTNSDSWEPFGSNEPGVLRSIYNLILQRAVGIFTCSKVQEAALLQKSGFTKDGRFHRLPYTIDEKWLQKLRDIREQWEIKPSEGLTAVFYFNDDAASFSTGFKESLAFASKENENKSKILVIQPTVRSAALQELMKVDRLVFLPNQAHPCPRLIMDARFMGVDVICNSKVEAQLEPWWQQEEGSRIKYLRDLQGNFMKVLDSACVL